MRLQNLLVLSVLLIIAVNVVAYTAGDEQEITLFGTFDITADRKIVVQPPDVNPASEFVQQGPFKIVVEETDRVLALPIPVDGDGNSILVTKGKADFHYAIEEAPDNQIASISTTIDLYKLKLGLTVGLSALVGIVVILAVLFYAKAFRLCHNKHIPRPDWKMVWSPRGKWPLVDLASFRTAVSSQGSGALMRSTTRPTTQVRQIASLFKSNKAISGLRTLDLYAIQDDACPMIEPGQEFPVPSIEPVTMCEDQHCGHSEDHLAMAQAVHARLFGLIEFPFLLHCLHRNCASCPAVIAPRILFHDPDISRGRLFGGHCINIRDCPVHAGANFVPPLTNSQWLRVPISIDGALPHTVLTSENYLEPILERTI